MEATAERPETALADTHPIQRERNDPLDLMRLLVEKGADADQLRTMLDLQRTVKADRAAEAYSEAMSMVQTVIPIVIRDKMNPEKNKKYASLEAVQIAIRPVYTKHGFALSFGTEDSTIEKHIRVVCDVHHVGGKTVRYHGDFPLDDAGIKGNANKTGIQATGSTMSYARRYLTLMIFNVTVADEDNDGAGRGLSGDMIAALNDVIGEIRELETAATAAGKVIEKPFNFQRFLDWLNVKGLDEVPASEFLKSLAMLHTKRKSIGGAKP